MNDHRQNIVIARKMSRRDFLLLSGLFLLTASGATGAFLYFSDLLQPRVEHGFGAHAFGAGTYGR
jgi:hypothetical protein